MSDDPAESAATPPASGPAEQSATSGNGKEDSEQDKANNPLGNEQRAFNEAYWYGHRFLSPRIQAQYGPTAMIGIANIQEMQIGDRTQIFVGHSLSRTPGPVREELLVWTRERYLAVEGYQRILETLRIRRVVLLRGQPGTGRITTALHLLDTQTSGRVFRLDSGDSIANLTEESLPEKNAGYVAELPGKVGSSLTEADLDKLQGLLMKKSAYCVLISESDLRHLDFFGGYAFDYSSPEPHELLAKHVSHEVLNDDAEDFESRLTAMLNARWVVAALGPCPRPLESVRMAALLAKYARNEVTQEEVERQAAQAVYYQVAEWFAVLQSLPFGDELDEALGLAAFRVALAVLNESPYDVVAEAAGLLSSEFLDATGSSRTRRKPLCSDDRESRLPALRAKIIDGHAVLGQARVPMQLLVFHDERYPVAVLKYVWENHHRMRASIVKWLWKLGKDPRSMVWVRAAQTTGYLCGLDFVYVFTKMIVPGASGAKPKWGAQRRRSAAIALDQAAQAEDLKPAILEWLRYWRRHGSPSERLTAAVAHGFALGRQQIKESLEELRILGTPSERQRPMDEIDNRALVWVAGFSIAKLLAFGEVRPVLDRLSEWICGRRSSLRSLALVSLDHLIDLYGFELDYLAMSVGSVKPALPAGAERWPLLIALQSQDPRLTEPIADLLRQSLRAREGGQIAKQFLSKWIRSSERDAEFLDVLVRFLPRLVETQADANRLCHLVERMRKDWAEPLRQEVVDRLVLAILSVKFRSDVA